MVKTYPWDPADYLETDEDMAGYLDASLEQDDHRVTALVLSDVARAKGMERAARRAGLDQESLDRANIRGDKLDFAAFMDMAQILGLRLYAGAASCGDPDFVSNSNNGAAKTRRRLPSPNCNSQEDLVSRLNSALARCDAWGAARAMSDGAAARGMGHIVPNGWESAASVRESEKRGDAPDLAIFMDAARALGMRIHAAVAHDDGRRRGRELAVKSS